MFREIVPYSCVFFFSLVRFENFEFQLAGDKYKGKIYIPLGPPPVLGDLMIITIKRTGLALTETEIYNWLRLFGSIEGELRHKYHPRLPTIKDDHAEVLMKLNKHIPSTLPANGKKVQVTYRGQPVQCSKCFDLGHIRRSCPSTTNNWLGYVKSLVDQKFIPDLYFGVWLDYLRAHEAVANSSETL